MAIVFITGGTGYIGKRLIPILLDRGHQVIALVRPGSEGKVPFGAEICIGSPFDAETIAECIPTRAVFVQLLGVPHPGPAKAKAFFEIDLPSVKASALAASKAGVSHFVYLSVAMEPSGIMKDYQTVRQQGEAYIEALRLPHTFLRPWYVLGPGHWWPLLLWPVYQLLKLLPFTRKKAYAFGWITLRQMLAALVTAVENPVEKRVMEVAEMKGL